MAKVLHITFQLQSLLLDSVCKAHKKYKMDIDAEKKEMLQTTHIQSSPEM